MTRGEVWWARLGGAAGRRPVLLLSRSAAYAVRRLIIVAPITTRIRSIPAEVPLGPEDGLPRPCVVNVDTITTIDKNILEGRLALLTAEKMRAVNAALSFALGMDE